MSLESDLIDDFRYEVEVLKKAGHSEEMIDYIINLDLPTNWYNGR
ncbi:MAG: hypothetical protein ACTSRG_22660 [Candidatus Helarchaeota archaeon]